MDIMQRLFRVYIRISGEYDIAVAALRPLNMMDLLKAVAMAYPDGDVEPLYDLHSEKFYEGRTKMFILRKASLFITRVHNTPSDRETMGKFVSSKQLKRLIRAFSMPNKCISGWALVYIYIIYSLLEGKSSIAADCLYYINALTALVASYLRHHEDDEIAVFFIESADLIRAAIQNNDVGLDAALLPGIPSRYFRGEAD